MKLSTSIIAYLSMVTDSDAQLAKKSSKRQELTRFGWKWPKCRDIDNCGCGGRIGSGSDKSGVISVGEVDEAGKNVTSVPYGIKQTCMWHITVPKKHSIHMEFDRDYGFEVEYHNFCGFDKVHLFAGHYAPGQDVQRIGRFCGMVHVKFTPKTRCHFGTRHTIQTATRSPSPGILIKRKMA